MGSYTLDDATTYVYRALRDLGDDADSQLLTATEIEPLIKAAAKSYSMRRPRTVVEDVTTDGTDDLALPGSWVDEVSRILSIETPTGENPPSIVDPRYYGLYQSPSDTVIRWAEGFAPDSGQTARVSYTALRTFEAVAANTTVLDVDFEAVCALAVALSAEAIASKYAQAHEPILSADVAGGRATKVQDWMTVASRWRKTYDTHLSSTQAPATGRLNWDTKLLGTYDHLTHPRSRR